MRKLTPLLIGLLAAAALAWSATAAPVAVHAASAKKAVTPGFYRGRTIGYFDFGPIKLKPGNKLAPIWTVTNGAGGQHNIIDTAPGQSDYTPLWQVNKVTFKPGSKPHLLRSRAAVEAATKAGEVTVAATNTVVNCPVLGFGQKRVGGSSAGKTIHYYDLGPVKVAPGNAVLPLVAVTNASSVSTTSPRTPSHRAPPTTRRSGRLSRGSGMPPPTSASSTLTWR